MLSPSETVTAFLERWGRPGELDAAFRDAFTPQTVWENVGWATTTGPEEAIALNRAFGEQTGMAAIRVENLAVAETGNKVLTERIDHLVDARGNTIVSVPVMGVFEVADGKIAAWRDYFDTKSFAPE